MIVAMPTNVTSYVLKSDTAAVRLIAESGFDAFDISLDLTVKNDQLPYVYKIDLPDYRERAEEIVRLGKELGIPCCAAHGPCINGHPDKEINERLFHQTVRALEVAAIIGAGAIVVHPIQYLNHASHHEEQRQLNFAFYRRLVPYARDFGIKIAVENLIERDESQRVVPAVCGTAKEFCEFVDTIDTEWITACLDLGHSSCAGVDPAAMIRGLGKERIYMLHIHDNDLHEDHHTLPYLGKIDFPAVIKALQDIHYDGILDYEVNLVRFPANLFPPAAKLVAAVGQDMKQRILAK